MSYTNGLDDPTLYFNTKLYTGNGTDAHSITGVGFQPDFVWLKGRSVAEHHTVNDIVRGANKQLYPHLTYGEASDTDRLQSFDSDGFTLGTDVIVNQSSQTFVSWNWLASNTTASNTDGSITSTVSANTTSGFSIVSWTANGSNGATIGHGLGGVTPNIIISKRRSAIGDWLVGGSTVNTVGGGSNKLLLLNSTVAIDTNSEVYQNIGASTFQVGVNAYINTNTSTMISYCFAEKKGFSKFGSYTGNGSADGTFVYTGFKPAFVIIKQTNTTGDWMVLDNKRDSDNGVRHQIYANTTGAESVEGSDRLDFLSNGIKHRSTGSRANGSGGTYIYMAFAESPFTTSTGIPTTAR